MQNLKKFLKNVGTECQDFIVYYKSKNKEMKQIRICAVRKTEKEIKAEQKKLRKTENRKQIEISEDTKFSHNYFIVVTSLDDDFSSEEIMSIYRLRWQVEMVFKRFKATPHKDCAADAQSDFSSDCTEMTQEY